MIEISTLLVVKVAACLVFGGLITACIAGVGKGVKDRSIPFTVMSLALLVILVVITLTLLGIIVWVT